MKQIRHLYLNISYKIRLFIAQIIIIDKRLFKQREILLRHEHGVNYFTLKPTWQRSAVFGSLVIIMITLSSMFFGVNQRDLRLEREQDLLELARFLDAFRKELVNHQHIYEYSKKDKNISSQAKEKIIQVEQSIATVLRNLEQPAKMISLFENADFDGDDSRYFSDRHDLTKQIMDLENHNKSTKQLANMTQENLAQTLDQLNILKEKLALLETNYDASLHREKNLKKQLNDNNIELTNFQSNLKQLYKYVDEFAAKNNIDNHKNINDNISLNNMIAALATRFDSIKHEMKTSRDAMIITADSLANISGIALSADDYEIPAYMLQQQIKEINSHKEKQYALLNDIQQFTNHHLLTMGGLFNEIGIDPNKLLRNKGIALQIGGPYAPIKALETAAGQVYSLTKRIEENINRSKAYNEIIACLPLDLPVNTMNVSSEFGQRIDPFTKKMAQHNGIDFIGWRGVPIYAPAAGIVTRAGRNGAYGRMIEIDHGCGITTRYGHLHKILVKKGEKLDYRKEIGKMGNTGRSTGTHLHYEIRFNGKPINPRKFIQAGRYVYQRQNTG